MNTGTTTQCFIMYAAKISKIAVAAYITTIYLDTNHIAIVFLVAIMDLVMLLSVLSHFMVTKITPYHIVLFNGIYVKKIAFCKIKSFKNSWRYNIPFAFLYPKIVVITRLAFHRRIVVEFPLQLDLPRVISSGLIEQNENALN